MDLDNRSPYTVATLPHPLPDGRYALVVVAKATYRIEPTRIVFADEQLPIWFADEVKETPQGVLTQFEADTALIKLRADIAVVGTVHSPQARPVSQLDAAVQVGGWSKSLTIFGARHWDIQGRLQEIAATPPLPFVECPLDFTHTYGGVQYAPNPVGKGFIAPGCKPKDVVGVPLPEIAHSRATVNTWNARQNSATLSFIAKSWQPRVAQLGTYDAVWEAQRAPHAPEDFLLDFYNATARDQQIDGYLRGDENVSLRNLGARPAMNFKLPGDRPDIAVISPRADVTALDSHLDTLCIVADESLFYLVWRGVHLIDDVSASNVAAVRVTQSLKPT
ncbi:MAG: DUF2169 domain-containing protein [Gammaproteobacteria bacterium]|nr:DUF2169 domain-containing protein [Gammaproteobacteria bacterium]